MVTETVLMFVLQNTSHMDTAAARGPCSDVTRARLLDTRVCIVEMYVYKL